jgi:uncharacterized repeat protein (TIGR03803 family)
MRTRTALQTLRATLVVLFILITVLASPAGAASKYKVLYAFKGGADGEETRGGVVFDQKGNLYGTTLAGGAGGIGTVFQLTPKASGRWTENVLYSFKQDGQDGNGPFAGLIFDPKGNLYGTTAGGGANGNYGTVFQLTPNGDGTWSENVLHSFAGQDGYEPSTGSLIFDQNGYLYGGTNLGGPYGYGVVFQLIPNGDGSWSENVLHSFGSGYDGTSPVAPLIFDQTGNLYGTAYSGGQTGGGIAFQLTPNGQGWNENVLYSFSESKGGGGALPTAGLIFDGAGNLYGTASADGADNGGTVFELSPDGKGGWTEQALYTFKGKDGESPYAGLIFDKAGNLYGTTFKGGVYGYGVVFKLTPNGNGGWTETVLHSFRDRPGANPWASLVFDSAGNLYGTTAGTGKTKGCVFEITP